MATVVEGDLKAPFSIATTPRCRGGWYSFPGLFHFILDTYLIMLGVKQGGIKYHFFSSGMIRPEIEPRSPLVNTLPTRKLYMNNLSKSFDGNFLNGLELIYLHTVKWFQVFQSKINNSI